MRKASTSKAQKKTSVFDQFTTKYRGLAAFATVALVILLFIGISKYNTYLNKFSDKDFSAIESAAENVMARVGAKEIKKKKSCSYQAPGKYESVHLYCLVDIVAYQPYENDENAIKVAKNLEKEVARLGSTSSYFDMFFFPQPYNSVGSLTVTGGKVPKGERCSFAIASNQKASRMVDFVPEKNNDGLIAIEFQCSAESREEYFPVIYRQGQ